MKNVIVGTAGHIDHGKTTLIKALTGIETDRLKEEKKRGITIDLGFAYFDLPNGKRAGIVDVPGHERFIKNMLAGASGIDLVILVIAADEGVMPQTQEHLDILSILEVKKGIIVLTKCDLVDEEWIELVIEDVKSKTRETFLENAPIVKVSALEGKGIDELKDLIVDLTEEVEEKNISAPLRLPIDRVFTMSGFGTIITGTLIEGTIEEKQTLEIYPEKFEVKVRSIQVHGKAVKKGYAGQRVAVNLAGIKKELINRGDILAEPDSMKNTMIVDVKLNLLKNSPRKIENWNRLRMYHGTKEVLCRVVLLDKEVLNPGESCYAQLRLEEETACKYGDRFVVRYYSPLETIGGGVILDPNAVKHKRFKEEVIDELEAKNEGDKSQIVENVLQKYSGEFPDTKFIALQAGIPETTVIEILNDLLRNKLVIKFSSNIYVHRDYIEKMEEELINLLNKYHSKNPLRSGISKEEVKSRLFSKTKGKLFDEIVELYTNMGTIEAHGNNVSLKGFEIMFSERQIALKDNILNLYSQSEFKPPTVKDIIDKFSIQGQDKDIIEALINMGYLVKINENIVFHRENYEKAKDILRNYLLENNEITLAEYRDLLDTSRKYVLPLLEHFDSIKLTKRVENKRTLY
ncbi:MAG: selenocysteine-specific elongation factor [Candidatus Petromonas sp.]|jgi:selenocysteine-specific elongation factor|nr:selenocysteine-specific elongation factor [Candidatus Petromonas sp.]